MYPKPASNRGKWLAVAVVAVGLIGAVVGWKFRVLEPREPARTTQPATP